MPRSCGTAALCWKRPAVSLWRTASGRCVATPQRCRSVHRMVTNCTSRPVLDVDWSKTAGLRPHPSRGVGVPRAVGGRGGGRDGGLAGEGVLEGRGAAGDLVGGVRRIVRGAVGRGGAWGAVLVGGRGGGARATLRQQRLQPRWEQP